METGKPEEMTVVMENSWNVKNWLKVLEFCEQSQDFTNFPPKLYQICTCFATTKKSSINIESLHFLTFSIKCRKKKLRKETVMENQETVMEKHFVKSVGTL